MEKLIIEIHKTDRIAVKRLAATTPGVAATLPKPGQGMRRPLQWLASILAVTDWYGRCPGKCGPVAMPAQAGMAGKG